MLQRMPREVQSNHAESQEGCQHDREQRDEGVPDGLPMG